MPFTLLLLALSVAALDWAAVGKGWRKVEIIAKPWVILILFIWLWQVSGFRGQLAWFAVGLGFSLVGDILLIPPKEKFILGFITFLLVHLSYAIGFNPTLPPLQLSSGLIALLVGLTSLQIYLRLAAALQSRGISILKPPFAVYTIAISLMLLSALFTLVRAEWPALASLSAVIGALFFYLSDTLLAWNKYVAPFRLGRLPSMVCYHLGQILITLGATLFFVG